MFLPVVVNVAVPLGVVSAALAAATNSSSPDSALLQYGAVGILALVLLVAVRYLAQRDDKRQTVMLASFEQTRKEFQDALAHERDRADRMEAALQSLYETTQGANLDALRDVKNSLDQAVQLIRLERDFRSRRRDDERDQ